MIHEVTIRQPERPATPRGAFSIKTPASQRRFPSTVSPSIWKAAALVVAIATAIALARPATAGGPPSRSPVYYNSPPKILVLRGVFEVFSLGMNDLARKLACRGYDVRLTSWSLALFEAQCSDDRPYVVIGHSLGGRMCAWVSRKLMHCGKQVPLIIIVDANVVQKIPANVDRCLHLYVTNDLGLFHGSPVRAESPDTEVINWDVSRGQPSMFQGGVNHFDIDATPWVHQIIIDEVTRMFPSPYAAAMSRWPGRTRKTVASDTAEPEVPVAETPPKLPPRRQVPWEATRPEIPAAKLAEQPRSPTWRPDRPATVSQSGTRY